MTSQLEQWRGKFGEEYTRRNQVDWRDRVDGFRSLIPSDAETVFEVGCNRGHNLRALQHLGLRVAGCEPMAYARKQARGAGLMVCGCTVYSLGGHGVGDLTYGRPDLVLTSGVLIHVPPEKLDEALLQIHRLSRKWVLAIEYEGCEEMVPYRGFDDMLWRREYGDHYERVTGAKVVEKSVAVPGFDGATCWLIRK